jgi:DNA-directed RNA polymerase subunit RPC12/RpoP
MLFICPRCGAKARVPDDALGKAARCPACGGVAHVRPQAPPPPPIPSARVAPPRPPYGGVKTPPLSPVKARADTLVDCPACGREVSRQAVSCPGCGHPLQTGDTKLVGEPGRVQLIEQTAKRLKLGILVSGAVTCVGAVGCVVVLFPQAEEARRYLPVSIWVTAVGFVAYSVFRLLAWWHHG